MQAFIKNRLLWLTTACLLSVVTLSGCHTGKKASSPKNKPKTAFRSGKQPKFIKGIYLTGHIKNSSTPNAVDTRRVQTRPAPAAKKLEASVATQPDAIQPKPSEAIVKKGKKQVTLKKEKEKEIIEEKPILAEPSPAIAVDKEDSKPIDLSSDYATCAKYADMVGIKCDEIINLQLYKFVDKWYGTNYRLGGLTDKGIDCSGFTQKLYDEVYKMEITRTAMEQYKNAECMRRTDDAEEGDLVFFKQRGKRITHVGVYLANDFFIHSSTSSGVVISNLKDDYWHQHYVGIGKMARQ